MRNLLIAFLLMIFSVQGAVVALGEHALAPAKVEQRWALAVDHAAAADSLDDAEQLKASAAIEELSDYLPADFSLPPPGYPAPMRAAPHTVFRSIDLPIVKPPPRAPIPAPIRA